MARLFISHSSVNNAAAIALRDWLFELGFKDDVFLDIDPQRGLVAGERWQQALKAAADRCEAVLFLVSPAWLASAWCRAEFLLAKSLQKRIFGLIIEPVPFEQVPVEMTAEWQMCELVGEDRLRTFDVALGVRHERVAFREAGLEVLRRGLERAGLDARSFPWPPANEPRRAPYRGLRALEPQDAAIFFGRDAAIVRGLDRIRGLLEGGIEKLLVVLGASGSGKSSFLRAGLWPRLVRDDAAFLPLPVIRPETAVITGSAGLAEAIAATFERLGPPRKLGDIKEALGAGPDGFAHLLDELADLAKRRLVGVEEAKANPSIVISIDQAEELFNPDGQAEAARFLELLGGVLAPADAAPARRVLAIATIRSDRYELLQATPHLAGVKQALFSLAPMPPAEFKSVIEGPARRVNEAGGRLEIEAALTEQLIADAQGADALPLLAFALEALYRDNRSAERLTLADYTRLGGVKGSIAAAVARALAEPGKHPAIPANTEAQYASLRAAFIPWLARIDPATGAPMRRVARIDEIPQTSAAIVERLVRERLLIADRRDGVDVIEVAHESLLRQWPALASWLEADADNLKLIEGVERAATEWTRNSRLPAWLDHRAERLAAADQLAGRDDFRRRLGPEGAAYLAACRTREATEKRRQRFFNQLVRGAAVIIAAIAGVALWQWREAQQQERISSQRAALLSTNLADNLIAQDDIDSSLLLLLESAKSFDDKTAPDKILIALQNATDKASTQESFYLSSNAKIFSVDNIFYIFENKKLQRFEASDHGALKVLGDYEHDVLSIQHSADKSSLIVLRADYNVDLISLPSYAVKHVGAMADADELKAAGNVAATIDPDGIVLAIHRRNFYALDIEKKKAIKAPLPADAKEFRYLTTFEGRRVFASPNNGFVYQADEPFTTVGRAETLDRLWNAIYLCRQTDVGLNEVTREYIKSNFTWKEYRDGDLCMRAGENFVFVVREHGTSAGSEYTYMLVDPRDKTKNIDIGALLLKRVGNDSGAPPEDAYLNTIDMLPKDKIFALSYNRFIYVFSEGRVILRTKVANTPSFTTLLSKNRLLVVQKGSHQQKLTLFWLGAPQGDFKRLTQAEKAKLTPLNKGSCTGYTDVLPREAALPDGSKIIFDTRTPTKGVASGVIRVESRSGVKVIDLESINPDCVQVNANFSHLLIKTRGRVDIYDFKAVLRNGSVTGAKTGSLVESNLSTSAFFVGDTDEVITAHWNNRVLRWRRTADGYVSEEIYAGDYPISYVEPNGNGKRLLMVESYGRGAVAGILYSVNAQRKWMTIVSNYKWIGLAFTSDEAIVFGDSNWEDKNSNYMRIKNLSEFTIEAKRLISKACVASPIDDYTKSPCWPDLAAE